MKAILVVTLAVCALVQLAFASDPPALLPLPQKVEWGKETAVLSEVKVTAEGWGSSSSREKHLAKELLQLLELNQIKKNNQAEYEVKLSISPVEAELYPEEAYELLSKEGELLIKANTLTGLYYGVQTLRQLIRQQDGTAQVPYCKILDYPAFTVRGYMADVGRNFQSIDLLKLQVDTMAAHKMNVFHWHLTDHFGWRLESKKYPGLQSDKAFERGIGKYYTQKEFVEFLAYCQDRHITVIPEFDSPGHSGAFRRGVGVENMRDPRALKAMIELIDELCGLADKEMMPYIHIGTDEVRHKEEQVDANYLPELHKAIHRNEREVVGWWHGMRVKGDTRQIFQTWAKSAPVKDMRHIDSRSNYVNHLGALDMAQRLHFQQVCRVQHGNDTQLGGILCYWPDIRIDDEKSTLRLSPVISSIVAYSEAVWHGIPQDRSEYWAKIPEPGSNAFESYAGFEKRLAEIRDRFYTDKPFYFVRTADIPWRLLGPVDGSELPPLNEVPARDMYEVDGRVYRWTEEIRGGTIHVRHFFGFPSHLKQFSKGKNVVWARTFIHSDKARRVKAWIAFNSLSSSDYRAGAPKHGNWSTNTECALWVNRRAVEPPTWTNNGKSGNEVPIGNEIYTNREPSEITLREGWNEILIKTSPTWKWCFTFAPIEWNGVMARELPDLRYSSEIPPAD